MAQTLISNHQSLYAYTLPPFFVRRDAPPFCLPTAEGGASATYGRLPRGYRYGRPPAHHYAISRSYRGNGRAPAHQH